MLKLYDFHCLSCDNRFEALVDGDSAGVCEACVSSYTERVTTCHGVFKTIQATSPNAKRYKAGYVHKYVNRPAEKISVQSLGVTK